MRLGLKELGPGTQGFSAVNLFFLPLITSGPWFSCTPHAHSIGDRLEFIAEWITGWSMLQGRLMLVTAGWPTATRSELVTET